MVKAMITLLTGMLQWEGDATVLRLQLVKVASAAKRGAGLFRDLLVFSLHCCLGLT